MIPIRQIHGRKKQLRLCREQLRGKVSRAALGRVPLRRQSNRWTCWRDDQEFLRWEREVCGADSDQDLGPEADDDVLPFCPEPFFSSADGWPVEPGSGRKMCTPERPMPRGAPGLWVHVGVVDNGGCNEGCCDDYKCRDCGATWRVEHG